MNDNLELYYKLKEAVETQTIIVSFKKKDGDMRVMIGTRNMDTVMKACNRDLLKMLYGFDKRANAQNGNIPVVDLALGEVRTFCVERIHGYQLVGELTEETLPKAFEYYEQVSAFVASKVEEAKAAKEGGVIETDSLISKIK